MSWFRKGFRTSVRRLGQKSSTQKFHKKRNRISQSISALESLEDRVLLTVTGIPWGAADQLTVSFAPDATVIAGQPNEIFSKFDTIAETQIWQQEILRAFQTWGVSTNVNVGVVPDGGEDFGIGGLTQGDSRFGDIRIGAIPMQADVFAISIPHDGFISGTWAGDIIFNSNANFQNVENIFSVALHESGHVLGLDHNNDPASPMFAHNQIGISTVPTKADVLDLQYLYGTRDSDLNELKKANDSAKQATRIRYSQTSSGYDGSTPLVSYGDISSNSDQDYFYLPVLNGYSGPVTFTVHTSGVSLLSPRLTVFDDNGNEMGSSVSSSIDGDVLSVTIPDSTGVNKYVALVEASRDDLYGIGSFSLVSSFDDLNTIDAATITTVAQGGLDQLDWKEIRDLFLNPDTVVFNDDLHTNETINTQTNLDTTLGFSEFSRYETVGSISDSSDIDFYRVKAPKFNGGEPPVMTVSLRASEVGGLAPKVTIFDRNGVEIPSVVLTNGLGELSIQAASLESGRNYLVKVEGDSHRALSQTGNYNLDVRFTTTQALRDQFTSGTLNELKNAEFFGLDIGETQLFHFALDVESTPTTNPLTAVQLTVFDDSGIPTFRMVATPGEVRTTNSVLLPIGHYTVRINAATADGSPLGDVSYSISGTGTSKPTGPLLSNTTLSPVVTCPNDPTAVCFPVVWTDTTGSDQTIVEDPTLLNPWSLDANIDTWYWFNGIL